MSCLMTSRNALARNHRAPMMPCTHNSQAMPKLYEYCGIRVFFYANEHEPAYQKLMEAAPALKPSVRAAVWIGDRRWDLMFEQGERLQLPEGEAAAAKAVAKFAELDGKDRLLGRGYLKFDMRDPAKLVIRMPNQVVNKTIAGEGA